MCGITGFMCHNSMTASEKKNLITKMTFSLSHRGPDFQDVWVSNKNNIALGHSRLSIQDLTENGNQPMFSNNKKYLISFNGEIYNHFQLRNNKFNGLENIKWNGNSDTETFVNLIEKVGLNTALDQVNGMFAFALLDLSNNKIIICRDKVGEKPLYYGIYKSFIAFGSELKIFKKLEKYFNLELRKDALVDFFKFGNIPSPKTIFKNIFKVEPGNYIEINLDDLHQDLSQYYNIKNKLKIVKWYEDIDNLNIDDFNSDFDYVSKLKKILEKSVEKQTISDVPIGSFLSGGVDSSLISSILQSQSSKKIDTFTIGFNEKKYDESVYAQEIAKNIGANNHIIKMSNNDLEAIFEKTINIYDEPFSDSSQIPTILLSEFTKKKVSVVMSGDGGDELFGGYYRHFYSNKIYKINTYIPYHVKLVIIKILKLFPRKFFDFIEEYKFSSIDDINTKILKFEKILLHSNTFRNFYDNLLIDKSFNKNLFTPDIYNNYNHELKTINTRDNIEDQIMEWDISEYLPNDILHKVDRATMSTGLEARLPMLDDELIKFSYNVPKNLLINKSGGKIILKKLLAEYIPSNLINRPKKGFAVPIYEWLQGPLYKWTQDNINQLIHKDDENLFNSAFIKNVLEEHKKGFDNSSIIWSLLIFKKWKENFI